MRPQSNTIALALAGALMAGACGSEEGTLVGPDDPPLVTGLAAYTDAPTIPVDPDFIKAFTEVSLSGLTNASEVQAFSELNFPALLTHEISGTVQVNGWSSPISHSETVLALAYVTTLPLPEADCDWGPINANASTTHTAGAQVRGVGFVTDLERSADFDTCEPACTSILDPALDPWDPDNECDPSGSGGSDDFDCGQEWIIVEVSYDGGLTWQVLWQGSVEVCE